ncbi:MAG: GyrI-like domain-containing protein [Gemmatimonadaceae bacterium]
MAESDKHPVSVRLAVPRVIAAVHARMPINDVPATFGRYLDQVYAAGRAGAVQLDGQNVFVCHDVANRPMDAEVAFGVGVTAPFVAVGAVELTPLPVGEVATTTHVGSYAGIRAAHHAVIEWCRANGRRRTGTRWEVYGHWTEDEARLRTDVFHLLEPAASELA